MTKSGGVFFVFLGWVVAGLWFLGGFWVAFGGLWRAFGGGGVILLVKNFAISGKVTTFVTANEGYAS